MIVNVRAQFEHTEKHLRPGSLEEASSGKTADKSSGSMVFKIKYEIVVPSF